MLITYGVARAGFIFTASCVCGWYGGSPTLKLLQMAVRVHLLFKHRGSNLKKAA